MDLDVGLSVSFRSCCRCHATGCLSCRWRCSPPTPNPLFCSPALPQRCLRFLILAICRHGWVPARKPIASSQLPCFMSACVQQVCASVFPNIPSITDRLNRWLSSQTGQGSNLFRMQKDDEFLRLMLLHISALQVTPLPISNFKQGSIAAQKHALEYISHPLSCILHPSHNANQILYHKQRSARSPCFLA